MSESYQPPPNQRDQSQRSNIPIPDPSLLTTEALQREVARLEQLFAVQLRALRADLETFKQDHEQRHIDFVNNSVQHLRELAEEKFRSVEAQFDAIQRQLNERDTRFRQGAEAADAAIKAAFAASKEAVAKSEAATTKQIDGLNAVIATSDAARQEQIRAIEKRVDRDEGKGAGLSQAWGIVIAAVTVLIGIVTVIVVVTTRGP